MHSIKNTARHSGSAIGQCISRAVCQTAHNLLLRKLTVVSRSQQFVGTSFSLTGMYGTRALSALVADFISAGVTATAFVSGGQKSTIGQQG